MSLGFEFRSGLGNCLGGSNLEFDRGLGHLTITGPGVGAETGHRRLGEHPHSEVLGPFDFVGREVFVGSEGESEIVSVEPSRWFSVGHDRADACDELNVHTSPVGGICLQVSWQRYLQPVTDLVLNDADEAALDGRRGDALAMAMKLIVAMAEISGAPHLIDISGAHIDGCLFHGRAGLDFAERLATTGATVSVPTTLNVASLDLIHPELYRGDPESVRMARLQMDAYVSMGCRPTWTCAPYQLTEIPAFGEQIAWAESDAIIYANSVLGARTNRYGDFIDIYVAITGRVPAAGLHLDENRRADVVFDVERVPSALAASDVLFPVLGHLIGTFTTRKGYAVPVIHGLPTASEDQLKALGAAAASSGSVGLFHVVGVTPEAPTLESVAPAHVDRVDVSIEMLTAARDDLTTTADDQIGAVSLGTPHASVTEIGRIVALLDGRVIADSVQCYVSTGRGVLVSAEAAGLASDLLGAGVDIVTDTCTYITPIIDSPGAVMTDSAKWAYYAPGNIGAEVVFGSTQECVETAVRGSLWRDAGLWDA